MLLTPSGTVWASLNTVAPQTGSRHQGRQRSLPWHRTQ